MTRPLLARFIHTSPAGLAAAGVVLAGIALGGCIPGYYPGGSLASRDLYTYQSTQDYPQTVTVVDTRTHEQIWSCDIPIGQELVIQFFEDHDEKSADRPSLMRWELLPIERRGGDLHNSLPMPVKWDRRVDVTLRKLSNEPPRGTYTSNAERQ